MVSTPRFKASYAPIWWQIACINTDSLLCWLSLCVLASSEWTPRLKTSSQLACVFCTCVRGSNPPFTRCWVYQTIIIKLVQALSHWLGESVRGLMQLYFQLFLQLFFQFVNICSMFLLCHTETLVPFLTLFFQVWFRSLHWLFDFKSKARKRTLSVSSLALSGNLSRDGGDDGSIGILYQSGCFFL